MGASVFLLPTDHIISDLRRDLERAEREQWTFEQLLTSEVTGF